MNACQEFPSLSWTFKWILFLILKKWIQIITGQHNQHCQVGRCASSTSSCQESRHTIPGQGLSALCLGNWTTLWIKPDLKDPHAHLTEACPWEWSCLLVFMFPGAQWVKRTIFLSITWVWCYRSPSVHTSHWFWGVVLALLALSWSRCGLWAMPSYWVALLTLWTLGHCPP